MNLQINHVLALQKATTLNMPVFTEHGPVGCAIGRLAFRALTLGARYEF